MEPWQEVLSFWLDEVGPKGWYGGGDELDATIRDRFGAFWQKAHDGGLTDWLVEAEPALAYLIVTDQFPRNIWRGDARSFATDPAARDATETALASGWDMQVSEPARQFFYMPLMHHEDASDQARCVALMAERMPETGASNHLHARAHQEIIRRFGRFPYRNAALGRENTPDEAKFLDGNGYGEILDSLKAAG